MRITRGTNIFVETRGKVVTHAQSANFDILHLTDGGQIFPTANTPNDGIR